MAYLPELNEIKTSRSITDAFRGYNHNMRIREDEFYDMKNMTSSHYPALAPRDKRGVYTSLRDSGNGIIANGKLCYVNGKYLRVGYVDVDLGLDYFAEHANIIRTLVNMGTYVIVFPDGIYVNTVNLKDCGNIKAHFSTGGNQVDFSLCSLDAVDYDAYASSTEPDPAKHPLWLDTSSTPNTLRQWSVASGLWVPIATTYIKISSTGIGKNFDKYDAVTISNLKGNKIIDSEGKEVNDEDAAELKQIDGNYVIWEKGDNYIVIIGMLEKRWSISNIVRVTRDFPYLDYVVESGNRLWGCRYGTAKNGEWVNEIYASKLGDFKNWNCFMGIASDSYVASVGTDGGFTGAVNYLGYPLFFKENCMHKVYGSFPSNYQIQTTVCRGVEIGSGQSLTLVGDVLYYKSSDGVYAYDGSLPNKISDQLGNEAYSYGVGGALGSKYYISMKDKSGIWHMFAYDTAKGMWHREDNTHALAMCTMGNVLYYIDTDGNNRKIKIIGSNENTDEDKVRWMCETGPVGMSSPDKKYVSSMNVRMSLDLGTRVHFSIQYDSCGAFESVCTFTGTKLRSFCVPIRPKRCDHFRLRIEGEGNAKIYSVTKNVEEGSDF